MIKDLFIDPVEGRYYIPLFSDRKKTYFVEKSIDEYKDEEALWLPGEMHIANFKFLLKRMQKAGEYDVPEDQIAYYMLII